MVNVKIKWDNVFVVNITYRKVESLCCIPESNGTLGVNYTQIKTF